MIWHVIEVRRTGYGLPEGGSGGEAERCVKSGIAIRKEKAYLCHMSDKFRFARSRSRLKRTETMLSGAARYEKGFSRIDK